MARNRPTVLLPLLGLISAIAVIYRYLRAKRDEAPRLYCTDSPLSRHIQNRCERLMKPLHTAWWARNQHVQTLLANILPSATGIEFDREYVHLPDGGIVGIDWAKVKHGSTCQTCPILLVFPGLTGDAWGMSHICKRALDRGYRPVVFNKRGHGGTELVTPKLQSFGDPRDLYEVVKHIRANNPSCVLTGVGFSAGAGILASFLGEYGSSCFMTAAVCVSPGYDTEFTFAKCVTQPYNFFLLRSLKKLVTKHAKILAKAIDVEKALRVTRLMDLEEELYCKLYHYNSLKEYWKNNNPVRGVENLSIPLLCISAVDDPICKKECIDYSIPNKCPTFMLATTSRGGHCGFLEGHRLDRWADKVSLDYLTAILEMKS